MTSYTVDFQPVGRRGECEENESLLACARRLGVGLSSICGGRGTCHSCKVKVSSGNILRIPSMNKEVFSPQELQEGWCLACQSYPRSKCTVSVPTESMTTRQRIQIEGLELTVSPEPPVHAYHLKLSPPTLSDPQADVDRLFTAINEQEGLRCNSVDIDVLRDLPHRLRSMNWECQVVVRGNEAISICPVSSRQLGMAVDLGTTKIAGYLVDLSSGRTLASRGLMNPQISYGEDVISRITWAREAKEKGEQLRELATKAINELARDLTAEVGATVEDIIEVTVGGNTTMHHLLLGLPTEQLALSPFVPAVSQAMDVKARDLGISVAPGAYVYVLPNIAGFVGGDHVAMLLAIEALKLKGLVIALDIGTNTEISLIRDGRITVVSCASGPVFEGGHIRDGMRAAKGAIERIQINGNDVEYETINDGPPVGICGSGILDALAQLYLAGVIDEKGLIRDSHCRVRKRQNQREFVLVSEEERGGRPAIAITQRDVRELQLAKAAIGTGIQTLLEVNDCSAKQIDQIIIAGAFGNYIHIPSAITIGMVSSIPLERFQQVGNAAGMGAKLVLVSLGQRAESQKIVSRVNYIELSCVSGFAQTFIEATYIGQRAPGNSPRLSNKS